MHYDRWRKTGSPGDAQAQRFRPSDGLCTVPNCLNRHEAHGYCAKHLNRQRKYGDTETVGLVMGDPDRRFAALHSVDGEDDCWLWTGHVERNGYARFTIGRERWGAHRWAYERFVGPIADGLTIDHLCRVRHCVNPTHMQVVTQFVNNRRAPLVGSTVNAAKTSCLRGHPFDEVNTYVSPANGQRRCRACRRKG
jgi:HNH endonuclease